MQYYGRRSCNNLPEIDFGPGGYIGSSRYPGFKEDQKKNPADYNYNIIGQFTSMNLCILFEEWIHKQYEVAKNDIFFNICQAVGTAFNMSGGNHNKTTKEVLSIKTSKYFNNIIDGEEHRKHISIKRKAWFEHPEFGMERRNDQSKIKLDYYNHPEFGAERIASISGGNSPQAHKILRLDKINHNILDTWDTIRSASIAFNIDENAIGFCARANAGGDNRTSGGFRWEFEDGIIRSKRKKA